MARTARGQEVLVAAREALKQAHTVAELRQAQAVLLPLEFGFSLEQVAMVTGISKGWVCQLRNRFIRLAGAPDLDKRKPGGRRHENMSREEEAAFLAPFFEKAAQGGILVVREIKQALDAHLGRTVPLSTVYICCTAITGASSLRTSGTSGPMPGYRQSGKKIPGIARHRRQPLAWNGTLARAVSG